MKAKKTVIINKFPYKKELKNVIIGDVEEEDLRVIQNNIEGEVYIFKYYEDNKRVDLTDYERNKNIDLNNYFLKKNRIEKITLTFAYYHEKKPTAIRQKIKVFYSEEKKYKNIKRLKTKNYTYELAWTYSLVGTDGFNWKIKYNKEIKRTGEEYEKYIAELYIKNGFKISYNGLKYGIKDNGIDLIGYKNGKVYLIQCKNWSLANEYKLTHNTFKEFIGNCYIYLKRRKMLNQNVIFHFISSNKIDLDKSAQYFLKNNQDIIKFKHVAFNHVDV